VAHAGDVCYYDDNSGNAYAPLCCPPGHTACFQGYKEGGLCCPPGTVCEGENTGSEACGALFIGRPKPYIRP